MTLLSSSTSSSEAVVARPMPRRRWVRRVAAFSVITLLLLWLVNTVLLAMAQPYKDGAALVCEYKRLAVRHDQVTHDPARLNVLFMGNSQIMAGMVPAEFDTLAGGRTFSWNLALPALPIGPHYFELKEYLERHAAPGLIILQLTAHHPPYSDPYNLFPYYATQGAKLSELLGYQLHRQNGEILKDYFFPIRVWRYRAGAGKYLGNLFTTGHEVADLTRQNAETISTMIRDRGYYFIRDQAALASKTPAAEVEIAMPVPMDRPRPDLEWDSDPYARKFFDLAHENHTRVLLIFAPTPPATYQPAVNRPAALGRLATAYDNVTIASELWQSPLYPNRLFGDPVHLNEEGALLFTRQVWSECQKAYPDLLAAK